MNSREEAVDFSKKYAEIEAYWYSHPEFENNPENEDLRQFAGELAAWYSSLSTIEKKQLTQNNDAGNLVELITTVLSSAQVEESPQYAGLIAEIRKQYENDVRMVIRSLVKHAHKRKAKQLDQASENDFIALRQWGEANQSYMRNPESGLGNLYEEFSKALNKAQYGHEHSPEVEKYKKRLVNALKMVNEGIATPSLQNNWKGLIRWYHSHIADILTGDEAYELPGKLAHALLLHVELLKKNNLNKEAESLVNEIAFIVDRDNLNYGIFEKGIARQHLHQVYDYLGKRSQRLSTNTKIPKKEREELAKVAGTYYFNAVRTAPQVETFNHYWAIRSSQGLLPSEGICNAFTTEAILFYGRRQLSENKTFIQKIKNKLLSEDKAKEDIRGYHEKLARLQAHDVSTLTTRRLPGLPTLKKCCEAMKADKTGKAMKGEKFDVIEILLTISTEVKHSILVRVAYNEANKAKSYHIIDATFGEASFPATEAGKDDFDAMMGILKTAYSLMYGEIYYNLVGKREALMKNDFLLFKSAPNLEKADLTFRKKIKSGKAGNTEKENDDSMRKGMF